MDTVNLNQRIAAKLGWAKHGLGYLRGSGDLEEHLTRLPDYASNLQLIPELLTFAAAHKAEFSFYMMLYETQPIFQAAFIQGRMQCTAKDFDPCLAIGKAFVQVFDHGQG